MQQFCSCCVQRVLMHWQGQHKQAERLHANIACTQHCQVHQASVMVPATASATKLYLTACTPSLPHQCSHILIIHQPANKSLCSDILNTPSCIVMCQPIHKAALCSTARSAGTHSASCCLTESAGSTLEMLRVVY